MKPDAIKAELRRLFTEAQKLESDLVRHQVEWATWDATKRRDGEGPPDWLIDKDDELVKPFEHLATSLYLTTVCFLDAAQLHAYLRQFYQTFGSKFDAGKAASEYDVDIYWSGEPFNTFLATLRQILAPLDVLGDADRYLKLSGVQYLEVILGNTASIIHKIGATPASEADVYKAVRHVLENIFPSAITPQSKFFKKAQEYRPDILIPELSSAVEYKYARDEAKLKAVIGQISDDVKGYTGDHDYNLFYAVFYVTNDFWGQAKFKQV
ncbi:hypothetical protein [Luteibacter sp. CQ10]|uniref:PD-(D/E)XK nuclease domain-containing protein n=1 Tax=Luteibacter sp. CQ10 TaxID=2805821 RepID=UPI0034A4C6D0